jgi:hypothetical protein
MTIDALRPRRRQHVEAVPTGSVTGLTAGRGVTAATLALGPAPAGGRAAPSGRPAGNGTAKGIETGSTAGSGSTAGTENRAGPVRGLGATTGRDHPVVAAAAVQGPRGEGPWVCGGWLAKEFRVGPMRS